MSDTAIAVDAQAEPTRAAYASVHTPRLQESGSNDKDVANGDVSDTDAAFQVQSLLYVCVALVLLQPMQFGWSISQLNLSTFHNPDDCAARPVADGTCLMFPGHTTGDWTWVVNLWIVGGMLGSLGCGRLADQFGRKRVLLANALVMVVGSVLQAVAPSVAVFAIGRFVSGVASGTSTALPNGYINEIAPPHLRNVLGVSFQIAVGVGIVLVGSTFFFANTSSGWRFIGGFPLVLASVFLLAAPALLVESPSWLLTKGRRAEAEAEIAKLYGQEHVAKALAWMAVPEPRAAATTGAVAPVDDEESGVAVSRVSSHEGTDDGSSTDFENPFAALFSPAYRQQTLVAVVLAVAQQLSGINAVFFYSSSLFQDAGLDDDRIGSVIVNVVNLLPTLGAGALGTRFGNKRMLLVGHVVMLLSAVGITISLVTEAAALSIVFTATYVAAFAVSLGPLVFVVVTSVFPNQLRASGTSLCLFGNWCGTLIVGVGYPHVAEALGDWGFVPFIVTLSLFALFLAKYLPETAGKTDEEIQAMFRSQRKALELE